MNALFSETLTTAISTTLLHSIWQGFLLFLCLKGLFTSVPSTRSSLRYLLSAGSLALLLIASLVTFHIVYKPAASLHVIASGNTTETFVFQNPSSSTWSAFEMIAGFVQDYDSYIVVGWLVGLSLFLLRVAIGWYVLNRIRSTANLLDNAMAMQLNRLAKQMDTRLCVALGESTRIASPMVIGILKPMVLLPAGLSTGLTTSQLEAIFIHELAHIRRHDFLLNVFQTVLESIFFFNPFTWMISSLIRSEREHCCDDAVVKNGVDAKSYAYALASLEELKLSSSPLAVSLSGNKNELLKRIKRLMEKSVTTYSLREKFVPALLLFIGLLCASWYSIQKNDPSVYRPANVGQIEQDTVIKKKTKPVKQNRKNATAASEATPMEKPLEKYDGEILSWPREGNFPEPVLPPMPNFEFEFGLAMPPGLEAMMHSFPEMQFQMDSIPPMHSLQNFEQFQRDFQEKFREQFGDFYSQNEDKIQEMMKELQDKYTAEQFEGLSNFEEHAREMERHARNMEEHSRHFSEHADRLKDFEFQMKWDEDNDARLRDLEQNLKKLEGNMKVFESALREELIKDGYIKSSDKIENIHWKDDGVIEINGIRIKDSDKAKYDALHKKYFDREPGNFQFRN